MDENPIAPAAWPTLGTYPSHNTTPPPGPVGAPDAAGLGREGAGAPNGGAPQAAVTVNGVPVAHAAPL